MKQNGFTLIELVIVIVILGILSVVAVPKFTNMQDQARLASAQGVKAALQSSANLIYTQAILEGVEKSDKPVELKNAPGVFTQYGYPTTKGIVAAVSLDGWTTKEIGNSTTTFIPSGQSGDSNKCYITYTPSQKGEPYSVVISAECGK
jgi:MSHA pilin protein MshA